MADAVSGGTGSWDKLEGKVAVVTGGASGIGKGMAGWFVKQGMKVVITDVRADALDAAAAEIGAVPIVADVGKLESVQALADATIERFGKVDLLCNNAGVAPQSRIADASMDNWRWQFDVNLFGVAHGINVFLPLLLANPDGGHIVNTASIGGFIIGPDGGIYGATKSGVVAASEALNWELELAGANVRVTILAPGPIRTGLFDPDMHVPADRPDVRGFNVNADTDPYFSQARWVNPADVGPVVMDAVRRRALYVTTHIEMADIVQGRFDRVIKGLRESLPV